jgi:hypothetical protein
MVPAKETGLFLDTSIQIARFVHSPKTKKAVEQRLKQQPKAITSLVVRQEFRRRLLKEAEYLLRLLHQYKSFDEVHHHVIRLFGPWHQRKRNICLETVAQVHGATDAERTERLRLYLRSLLVAGLSRFDQKVDEIRKDSGCACGLREIVEKVPLRKYDLGTDRCSKTKPGSCGVIAFFQNRKEVWEAILAKLKTLPDPKKSTELKNAEKFLERLTKRPDQVNKEDPCLTVGDVFIALESAGISHFLTLNGIESQHLCRALGQSLIVRPVDPTKPDVICASGDPQWPAFGPDGGSETK